jgi:putative aldouronate transport system substrate-binding protein
MKRTMISLLILMMAAGVLAAGGVQEQAAAADETVVIDLMAKDFSDDWTLAHLAQVEKGFEEYSGKKIKFNVWPTPEGAYAEKLNLMLLSGEIPDLIYFQGGDETAAAQGILTDLKPFVDNSEIMQEVLLDFNKQRLENYPYLLWVAPARARVAVVREDWFAEAGGKVPVTVDDYYQLFKEIKANHPDAWVMTDTEGTVRMDFTFDHAFGLTATWVEENGSYVYRDVSQGAKDKLAFYQKLYAEGILDHEYITTKWDTMEDKLYTGKVGLVYGTSGIVLDIYNDKLEENQGVSLVALPPAKGVGQGYAVSSAKETRGWAISSISDKKELVFEVLEYLATDEGQFLERYGLEGIHYVLEGDEVVLTDESANWWPRFHEVMGWKGPTPVLGPVGQAGWDFVGEYAVGDPDFPIPEELSPTWDALQNLTKEYSYKIISGEYSINKFDEYVKQWYALGGDKVTAYANERLN